jgi:hypothetical protein
MHNHDINFYNMLEMIKLKASYFSRFLSFYHCVAMATEPINVVGGMKIYLLEN